MSSSCCATSTRSPLLTHRPTPSSTLSPARPGRALGSDRKSASSKGGKGLGQKLSQMLGRKVSLGLALALTLGLSVLHAYSTPALAHTAESNDPVTVVDSLGHTVHLPTPAHRVVALAPHVTEMIAAAGGLDTLVGVIRDSDFPPMVKLVPQVGSAAQVDIERLITLEPDLVVGWQESLLQPAQRLLRQSDIAVYYSAPTRLEQIPEQIESLGALLGTPSPAKRAATEWRKELARLQERSQQHSRPLNVFIEVGRTPLYTLNQQHIVTQAIETCGGRNVFADAPTIAPVVGVEAVLTSQPDLIIVAERPTSSNRRAAYDFWQRFAEALPAAQQPILIDPDLLVRPGPRLLEGLKQICNAVELRRRQLAHLPQ